MPAKRWSQHQNGEPWNGRQQRASRSCDEASPSSDRPSRAPTAQH